MGVFAARSPGFTDDLLLIDSTPIECARSRETVLRSALGEATGYGYCASHSRFFWGFRLHGIFALDGTPRALTLASPKRDERVVGLQLLARCRRAGGETLLADGAITSIVPVPGVAVLRGLACSAPGVCTAVGVADQDADAHGVVVRFTGGTPPQTLTVSGTDFLRMARCLPTGECIAVGDSAVPGFHGVIVRLTGYQARVAKVAAIQTLSGVTCPSSTLCWTVGSTGSSLFHSRLTLAPFGP